MAGSANVDLLEMSTENDQQSEKTMIVLHSTTVATSVCAMQHALIHSHLMWWHG